VTFHGGRTVLDPRGRPCSRAFVALSVGDDIPDFVVCRRFVIAPKIVIVSASVNVNREFIQRRIMKHVCFAECV